MTPERLAAGPEAQGRLIEDILSDAAAIGDAPVTEVICGRHLVAVSSRRMGLCSRIGSAVGGAPARKVQGPVSARELAIYLRRTVPQVEDSASYAMAAVNSILPVPRDALPLKAQDLIRDRGKGKNVSVIGHFSFVEKMKQAFRNLWVFELHPRGSDLPADAAPDLLPGADVVAMTATTLLNGTCAGLLKHIRKDAFTIMLGPSTPFAPCLFRWGIDALAGCRVTDPLLAAPRIRKGDPFKRLEGVDSLIWVSP